MKKVAIFVAAVLAFVAVATVAEAWLRVPKSLAQGLGVFVMGLVMKPLAAPELPMSRWVMVTLVGAGVGLAAYLALDIYAFPSA